MLPHKLDHIIITKSVWDYTKRWKQLRPKALLKSQHSFQKHPHFTFTAFSGYTVVKLEIHVH